MNDLPDFQSVQVLLKVDDHAPVSVDTFITDQTECGRTQIGVALIELGSRFIDSAVRAEKRA